TNRADPCTFASARVSPTVKSAKPSMKAVAAIATCARASASAPSAASAPAWPSRWCARPSATYRAARPPSPTRPASSPPDFLSPNTQKPDLESGFFMPARKHSGLRHAAVEAELGVRRLDQLALGLAHPLDGPLHIARLAALVGQLEIALVVARLRLQQAAVEPAQRPAQIPQQPHALLAATH